MMMRIALTLFAVASMATGVSHSHQRDPLPQIVDDSTTPEPVDASTAVETLIVAHFTFDGPVGTPDSQGWTVHDLTADVDTFFHVADSTELDGGDFGYLVVLEGNQSLWCGATYEYNPELCHYASLPGYGAFWRQSFVSKPFPRSGDVGVSYLVSYDTEPGYDDAVVYYWDKEGYWKAGKRYDGQGRHQDSFVIPDSALTDSVRLMLRFTDSSFWNDETGLANLDGAVIFDSLTVWDSTGVIEFEDFEDEIPGALTTADGDWQAYRDGEYGKFAGLYPGAIVLQEDTLVTNFTYMWGFFSGSTYDYTCGGYVSQPVVPYAEPDPVFAGDFYRDLYIYNEIWSPVIDWTHDIDGDAIGSWVDQAFLEFDVYSDLPQNALVFYLWRIRTVTDGCGDEWMYDNTLHFSDAKSWHRARFNLDGYLSPTDTYVQVALGVRDMCGSWCGIYGDGSCHSHAPLFDNVTLIRAGPVASSADGEVPRATALGENYPNPFNPVTTIPFTLARRTHARLEIFDVSGRLVRVLVDEKLDAGSRHTVEWDGRDANGTPVASGVYFSRLTAGGVLQTRKMTLLK